MQGEQRPLLSKRRVGSRGGLSSLFALPAIRKMFDLGADWAAIVERLRSDRALVGSVEADPGLRVPGCWNGFELAVRAILG